MTNILVGCIKQSRDEYIKEIAENRKSIKIGCILQSYNNKNSTKVLE